MFSAGTAQLLSSTTTPVVVDAVGLDLLVRLRCRVADGDQRDDADGDAGADEDPLALLARPPASSAARRSSSSRLRRSARSRARRSARVGSRGVVVSSCDACGRGAARPSPPSPAPGPPACRSRRAPSFPPPPSAATRMMSPLSDGATFDSAARRSGPATRRRSTPNYVTLRHGHSDGGTARPPVPPSRAETLTSPPRPAETGSFTALRLPVDAPRRGPLRAIAIGNGMMTIDMDHSAPQRRSAGSPVSAPRIDGPPRGTRQRPAPVQFAAPRRLAAGVLVGALTMLVVATLDTVDRRAGAGARVVRLPAVAGGAAGGRSSSRHPPATPGTCLNWTRADAADTHVVDCAQAAPVRAGRHRARWPTRRRCPTTGSGASSSASAATRSSSSTWAAGSTRTAGSGSARSSRRPPSGPRATGSCAAGCRARRGRARCTRWRARPSSRTSRRCTSRAPAWASTGARSATRSTAPGRTPWRRWGSSTSRRSSTTTSSRPSATQDEFLQTECTKIATAYAGGADVIGAKKLTVYWDNLTEESWKAGTRRVNCNLAALLPDRSGFAPVTGSVRGPVTVGDTPAPPATGTPEPGVPAQVPPVEPARPRATPPAEPAPSATPPPPGTDAPPLDGTPEPPPADDDATPADPPEPEQPEPPSAPAGRCRRHRPASAPTWGRSSAAGTDGRLAGWSPTGSR